MGKFKGIIKSLKGGLKMVAFALPTLGALVGLSLTISSCSMATPDESFYRSYRNTEYFKEVYMEDVSAAQEAYKEGYITNAEYQKRIEKYDSDQYLEEKIREDTEHPEYKEALDKRDEGLKNSLIGVGVFGASSFAGAIWYGTGGKSFYKSAVNDLADAKREFKKKNPPKPKTQKMTKNFAFNDDEDELPSIDDQYYND